MNIVIRSPNWIGDCVMALPAIRALKHKIPDANIYVVAKEYLCDVFKYVQEIRQVIPLPNSSSWKSTLSSAKMLKTFGFQEGILFTNSISSAILFRLAGIKNLTGYCKDLRGFLLRRKQPFPKNNTHHIQFYLDLIALFTQSSLTGSFSSQLVIQPEERKETLQFLETLNLTFPENKKEILLGVSPSAAYGSAKQWLPDRFSKLIVQLKQKHPKIKVLFFGTQKEAEKIQKIVEPIEKEIPNSKPWVYNLAGKLPLRQSIVTISLCHAFISNDSGLMHVASSLNLPLIALFGPTRPEKTGPRNPEARVIHHRTQCGPCLDRDCPYEDHPCMAAITVEEVLGTLESLVFASQKKAKRKTQSMPKFLL